MSRILTSTVLLYASVAWGLNYVAMKLALQHMGPFSATGMRMALAALVMQPADYFERRRAKSGCRSGSWLVGVVTLLFSAACGAQQIGIAITTVSNGGFLASSVVIMVPFASWIVTGRAPHHRVWPAAMLELAGIWKLSGATLTSLASLNGGDALFLVAAASWAMHYAMLGKVMTSATLPCTISFLQCLACSVLFPAAGIASETLTIGQLWAARFELLYLGLIGGGLVMYLQAVAQAVVPATDTSLILSLECVFAANFAFAMLDERVTAVAGAGALVLVAAVLLAEPGPAIVKTSQQRQRAGGEYSETPQSAAFRQSTRQDVLPSPGFPSG